MNLKVTKIQQDVLDKMNDGWELGRDNFLYGRSRVQQGGLGRGGRTQTVSWNTIRGLLKRGLIREIHGFPDIRYVIIKEQIK